MRVAVVEAVHEHQHSGVRDLGDVDLRRRRDAVLPPEVEDAGEARGERCGIAQLRGERAVERAPARHARRGARRLRVDVEQIVGAALDPPGVAGREEIGDLIGRHGEHAGEIPAGEREDAGLPRVVGAQQQVRVADGGDVLLGDVVEPGDALRRRDERGRRAGDAVLGEDAVVVGRAGEALGEVGAHLLGELTAGDLAPAEAECIVAVPGRPVDELVRELVVVLQPVHELHGLTRAGATW